ncbi:MAG: cytochrome c [Gaiellaceae bacterium MAG52_C11]|nr:cytochrome c [Candidatus Gaiellasilicea maunaloa]
MCRSVAIALAALALAVAGGLTACGGSEETSATPETVEGTLPATTAGTTETETETTGTTTETEPTSTVEGDAAAGESVWASAGCGGCHTLEAANSSGNVGPNLDEAQPDAALTTDRVTNGMGAMPAFGDQLNEKQIADVVAYVVASTSG